MENFTVGEEVILTGTDQEFNRICLTPSAYKNTHVIIKEISKERIYCTNKDGGGLLWVKPDMIHKTTVTNWKKELTGQ